MVHYPVHQKVSLVTVVSQMNPFHTLSYYFRKIIIMIFYLRLGLSSDFFPHQVVLEKVKLSP
jgi:hypothetical protein